MVERGPILTAVNLGEGERDVPVPPEAGSPSRPRRWRFLSRAPVASDPVLVRLPADSVAVIEYPPFGKDRIATMPTSRAGGMAGPLIPLGARYDGAGTNFSSSPRSPIAVELCLFDEGRRSPWPSRRWTPSAGTPTSPESCPGNGTATASTALGAPEGQRCNPNKLLIDPYAKAIEGAVDWAEACFTYRFADPGARNDGDSAPHIPKGVVHNPLLRLGQRPSAGRASARDHHLRDPPEGVHQTLPDVPEALRGTYAGMAHPAAIDYLQSLGITTLELLPVHQFVQDSGLGRPPPAQLLGVQLDRFLRPPQRVLEQRGRRLNRCRSSRISFASLHEANIEVILDVVYNHTAEGNHLGPDAVFQGNRQPRLLPPRP